jgi:phosphoserine phosphatase RsbU/P
MLTSWERSGFLVSAERRGAGGAKGGDFYTLAVRAPGRIGVVIGDACGRGADGEAQLALILPRVRELALSGLSPARLLSALNRTVIAELALDRFVTAAAFELDTRSGGFTVANAGHVPAMLRRAGQVSVVGRASGAPLGFSEDTTYTDEHHELSRGDVMVLMTDGVLEAVEADLTTMSTLQTLLAETRGGASGVHRFLLRRFEECTAGRRADDMTLVALEALMDVRASNTVEYAKAS